MSEPRYWFIQKPVANNVPLERNGAVFVRHQPTVSEQNCEWVKVWSSEDLSKEMGMGVTKWVELNRKVRELEAQLKEANEALSWYADEKNWEEVWMDFGGDDGRDGDVLARIDTDDCEVLDDELGMYFGSAGKRARAYLKKWEGEK